MHSTAYNNLSVIKPHAVYMLTFIKKRWSQHGLTLCQKYLLFLH